MLLPTSFRSENNSLHFTCHTGYIQTKRGYSHSLWQHSYRAYSSKLKNLFLKLHCFSESGKRVKLQIDISYHDWFLKYCMSLQPLSYSFQLPHLLPKTSQTKIKQYPQTCPAFQASQLMPLGSIFSYCFGFYFLSLPETVSLTNLHSHSIPMFTMAYC